jgi:vacuolar-type H+-ATPase subunit I/STV1
MDPAYLQTSLSARELWNETESGKREKESAEQAKREEEKTKKERERIVVAHRQRTLRKIGNVLKSLEY